VSAPVQATTLSITRPVRLGLEPFARATNLHPQLVRRFVELELLEATRGANGELWFAPSQVAVAARLQRLRAAFALNYAALGLVVELLDRIADLEATARTSSRTLGGQQWT
jgi:hypothetical protein